MDPDDPNGQDDLLVYSPEAHLPLDKPVKFVLRSKDVLHDFAVAQFRVKMDLVPGMQTFLWLTPIKTGRFEILCEELCGIAHHTMRGAVIVETQEEFDAWLDKQATWAQNSARVAGNAAVGAAQYATCAACHGQQGEGLQALNAPKLAGQSAWYLKRQLQNYQNGSRGAHENDVFGKQMAPMAAILVDEAAIDNVIAHIQSFPDDAAPHTIDGDIAKGQKLYTVCAYCHTADAAGVRAMNAPRLAGMTDWYLARQIENFKEGIRGAHLTDEDGERRPYPTDFYGFQMGLMARTLHDEQAINDLVAYINTL
jgi:cytochrome c oxidase subunit 2